MTSPPTKTIHVDLADRAYTVTVGQGILNSLPATIAHCCPSATKFLLAIDHNIPNETVAQVVNSLQQSNLSVIQHTLIATEEKKSFATLTELLASMANARLSRSDLVIALGGGIVGDTAGYAAASYMRGLPIIQCPTTLLSMVDAAVGGKTGVNLLLNNDPHNRTLLKNYAGAFWQPAAVLADVHTLSSLQPNHFCAGLAECIKHDMLCATPDADPFEWITTNLDAILKLDPATLIDLITNNITIKARIVQADEREEATDLPGRAALNLGHTFAHVIESFHPHNSTPLLHGNAVSLGLIAAAVTSREEGYLSTTYLDQLKQLLVNAGLPVETPNLPDNESLRARMLQDKKTQAGSLRLILPVQGAGVILTDDASPDSIDAGWDEIRA